MCTERIRNPRAPPRPATAALLLPTTSRDCCSITAVSTKLTHRIRARRPGLVRDSTICEHSGDGPGATETTQRLRPHVRLSPTPERTSVNNARQWGPVLLQVAESLQSFDLNPVDRSEIDLYWDIIFGAAHQHSVENFTERSDPKLDRTADLIDQRLSSGWLAGPKLESPQSVFNNRTELRPVRISNPSGYLLAADKPVGALWTSSFLPDGESAWERLERSEFSQLNRSPIQFKFDLEVDEKVRTIRSVADYVELVESYPRKVSTDRVAVDWEGLSRGYTAVTLAASGLARAQNFRIYTEIGLAELTGWDAESTAWLHLPKKAKLSRI